MAFERRLNVTEIESSGDISRETHRRLGLFLEVLQQWSLHTNLVSNGDQVLLQTRHLLDSIRLAQLVDCSGAVADLGTGAGFPGLILAIVLQREVTLIEANHRKAAFLREAARLTEAPVIIHAGRIEDMDRTFDLITARAVAPLATLLSLVSGRLTLGGRCLFPKGRNFQSELDTAGRTWTFQLKVHVSATDPSGRILELNNIAARKPA